MKLSIGGVESATILVLDVSSVNSPDGFHPTDSCHKLACCVFKGIGVQKTAVSCRFTCTRDMLRVIGASFALFHYSFFSMMDFRAAQQTLNL
jgi:hypothetical protein